MGRQLLGWLLFFTLSHARCLAVQHIRQDTSWISGAKIIRHNFGIRGNLSAESRRFLTSHARKIRQISRRTSGARKIIRKCKKVVINQEEEVGLACAVGPLKRVATNVKRRQIFVGKFPFFLSFACLRGKREGGRVISNVRRGGDGGPTVFPFIFPHDTV